MRQQRPTIPFRYTFLLSGGREKTFDLALDADHLGLVPERRDPLPAWTDLSCCRCPNCPLGEEDHPRCPIAASIVELVDFFTDVASHEGVDVRVGTTERGYVKRSTTADAVSSLLGIYMVTSGCPVMDKLRPMVRFHLPLASPEETRFRVLAMYLTAQYFRRKRSQQPDWDLERLPGVYREVQIVNRSFIRRLHQTGVQDATLNAVVRLDSFASLILMSIDMDSFDDLEALFEPYFD